MDERGQHSAPDGAATILVCDDDPSLRELVRAVLGPRYRFLEAADGTEALALARDEHPDLIVLDVMLPGEDGLSIVKRLKSLYDVPVLMLSARRADIDRILGLEMGADDYLTKPFHPRELLARIHARLRRSPERQQVDVLESGSFRLDRVRREAYKHGRALDLSTADFSLLSLFMRHSHRVLDRTQLVDLASAMERMPFDRSIDVRVARLRRKIEDDPSQPRYIRTVRGSGYLFIPGGGDTE